jgi:hypothetical protein
MKDGRLRVRGHFLVSRAAFVYTPTSGEEGGAAISFMDTSNQLGEETDFSPSAPPAVAQREWLAVPIRDSIPGLRDQIQHFRWTLGLLLPRLLSA